MIYIYIYVNILIGTLPSEIWSLTNLNYIYLSYNDFSGILYIYNLLHNLNLFFLTFFFTHSHFLFFSFYHYFIWPNILNTIYNYYFNILIGTLPTEIGSLTQLNTLDLADNYFSGII